MSCCCCVTPRQLLDGIQEEDRDQMEVSVLRERYRSCRETQRIHPQVLLLQTVSEDVVTVPQGLMLLWEPTSTSDLDLTFDPWHVHLDLHQRCRTGGTRTSTRSSRRSESGDRNVSLVSDSLGSSRETSLCGSSSSSRDDCLAAALDSDGSGEDLHPDLQQLQTHQENSSRSRRLLSFPFPSRKTPRISEAARRLGMYSSF
ncbi:uncharacterized protein LOC118471576 [Amphiprion ocellaris]|uniref:uncharacterized protein LOC118471576 n=1 Tax=Amphiprion ocellaris TaxID=80972 RepID=UPI002411543A|nr:uncharacterized protein LOC118471576 [Amphiprion ocellaris]